jgi:arylsulfatase A-like enzyme
VKPNILFLVIDSLRSDKCYDKNKTSITPNIDSLIKKGIFFSQTISSVASTSPSMGSIFTGMFPFKTGMIDNTYQKLNPAIPTYIEHFKKNGYTTFATTSEVNSFLGLTEDFDLKLESSTHNNYFSLFNGLGEKIVNKLNSIPKEPWFFYIHINDLHQPIIVPKDFNEEKFGETDYDQMVSAIDSWIGSLLKKTNLENTLIVLTADHGEYIRSLKINDQLINLESGMGEKTLWKIGNKVPATLYGPKKKISSYLQKIRNSSREKKIKNLSLSKYEERILTTSRMSQGSHIYDDVLKVPLIFAGCNIKSSKIISQQVGLVDIFPTITKLIGLKNLTSNIDGTILIPLFTNEHLDEKPIFIQSMPHIADNHKNYVGIRTSEFKYIQDSENDENFELFDLTNDPLEQYDVSNDFSEIVTKMKNILQDYLKQEIPSDSQKLDDVERKKVEEELKKLGYI